MVDTTTIGNLDNRTTLLSSDLLEIEGTDSVSYNITVSQITALVTADSLPLTTKGDLVTFSTQAIRLGVGANDTVLTADSSETTGLKWASVVTAAITSINADTTAAQIIAGTTNAISVATVAGTTTLNIGSNVVTLTGIQVLTNKTLTTPTIADFTNSAHDHEDAEGGAQLVASTALNTTGTAGSTTFLRGDNAWAVPAGGDVSGPGTSTDTAIAKWNGAGGATLQDSGILITTADDITGIHELLFETGTAPAAAETGFGYVNGDSALYMNVISGQVFALTIAGTSEFQFSSTALNCIGNDVTNAKSVQFTNDATLPGSSTSYIQKVSAGLVINATTATQISLTIGAIDNFVLTATGISQEVVDTAVTNEFYSNYTTTAAANDLAIWNFYANNDNLLTKTLFAQLEIKTVDVANGTEDATVTISTMTAGTLTDYLTFNDTSSGQLGIGVDVDLGGNNIIFSADGAATSTSTVEIYRTGDDIRLNVAEGNSVIVGTDGDSLFRFLDLTVPTLNFQNSGVITGIASINFQLVQQTIGADSDGIILDSSSKTVIQVGSVTEYSFGLTEAEFNLNSITGVGDLSQQVTSGQITNTFQTNYTTPLAGIIAEIDFTANTTDVSTGQIFATIAASSQNIGTGAEEGTLVISVVTASSVNPEIYMTFNLSGSGEIDLNKNMNFEGVNAYNVGEIWFGVNGSGVPYFDGNSGVLNLIFPDDFNDDGLNLKNVSGDGSFYLGNSSSSPNTTWIPVTTMSGGGTPATATALDTLSLEQNFYMQEISTSTAPVLAWELGQATSTDSVYRPLWTIDNPTNDGPFLTLETDGTLTLDSLAIENELQLSYITAAWDGSTSITLDDSIITGILNNSADETAGATVIIPSADILQAGRVFIINDESFIAGNVNTSTGVSTKITLTTEGSETIDGEDEAYIQANGGTMRLYSNGTNLFSW